MANQQLADFLREKKEKAASTDIDWGARRDEWILAVEKLYDTIAGDYLEGSDAVEVDRSVRKSAKEMHVGSYLIPEMTLNVGDEQVVFTPKGFNVVGARGRVDVQGERGEASLVLQDDSRWSLVVSRTPRVQLVPLDEDSFLEMLRSVMR